MKRRIATMLLFMVTFFTLTACSGGGDSPAEAEADEQKEITIWCWDENFNIKAAKIAKEYYEKENPNVTVTVVSHAYDEIVQKLNIAFASGTYDGLPNIALIEDYSVSNFHQAFPGELRDLSDIIDPKDWMDYKLKPLTYDNKIYGVPFDSSVVSIFYRTDLLEQAGYTIEDVQDITWDELIEIAKKIKETSGVNLFPFTIKDMMLMKMIMQSTGRWYVDENGEVDILDNYPLKESLRIYKEMVDADVVEVVPGWDEMVQSIQQGKVATVINGCWMTAAIKTAEDQSGLWAIAPLPILEGVEGATHYSNSGGASWFVIDKVEHADTAVDFLDKTLANNTEVLNTVIKETSLVSTRIDDGSFTNYDYEDPFFQNEPVLRTFSEWAQQVPMINYGVNTINYDNILGEELMNILGGEDLDEAMKAIHERALLIEG